MSEIADAIKAAATSLAGAWVFVTLIRAWMGDGSSHD